MVNTATCKPETFKTRGTPGRDEIEWSLLASASPVGHPKRSRDDERGDQARAPENLLAALPQTGLLDRDGSRIASGGRVNRLPTEIWSSGGAHPVLPFSGPVPFVPGSRAHRV